MGWFKFLFLEPLKKLWKRYVHLVLFIIGGTVLVLSTPLGMWFNELFSQVQAFHLNKVDFSVSLNTLGSVITVSGVYGFITKSSLLSEYYGNIFFDVIYRPSKKLNRKNLMMKWGTLSKSLLEEALPFDSERVVEKLGKYFLEGEMDYGFKNVEVVIKVKKIPGNHGLVKVFQVFRADIVYSKNKAKVVLKQKIKVESDSFSVKSILINDKEIGDEHYTTEGNTRFFEYTIDDAHKYVNGSFGTVKINRTFEFTQDVTKDPIICGAFSRYIEGMTVLVKTSGVKGEFRRNGLEATTEPKMVKDGSEYKRHILADPNTLLLPGEGYTLTLTLPGFIGCNQRAT